MIEREDGPIKHYRMVCNSCGKQTKRFAYEFYFKRDAPSGWKEKNGEDNRFHHCPKCSSIVKTGNIIKEIVPNIGDTVDISDHAAASRPLVRKAVNELVVKSKECHWIITSDTQIKVEEQDI